MIMGGRVFQLVGGHERTLPLHAIQEQIFETMLIWLPWSPFFFGRGVEGTYRRCDEENNQVDFEGF